MRFGILGPLVVDNGDRIVTVPAARQRVVLSALLVRPRQAVPVGELTDIVWDGAPPLKAAATLRTHVMRLRAVLGAAGCRVVTRYPGYLADAADDEVDLFQFTSLCREGSAAMRAGAWQKAAHVLASALALWRATPLADIPSDVLRQRELPALEQLRLQALEWRIDAGLHLGRHHDLVPELQRLTAANPLRERFHAQLMLALYACDRQAEALAVYRSARQILAEEVGAEPGPGLREPHQQILVGDPLLTLPHAAHMDERATAPQPTPISLRHWPRGTRGCRWRWHHRGHGYGTPPLRWNTGRDTGRRGADAAGLMRRIWPATCTTLRTNSGGSVKSWTACVSPGAVRAAE